MVMDDETLRKEISILVTKKSVNLYALKVTRQLLGHFNQSETELRMDAEDALSTSVIVMLKKISDDSFDLPEHVNEPQAFLMSHLKMYLNHHLLKRYARRSQKKPVYSYQKEKLAYEGAGDVSRYSGPRFDKFQFEDDYAEIGISTPDLSHNIDIGRIEVLLDSKGLSDDDILVIKAKALGFTYAEIGEFQELSADNVRMRFNRAMKKGKLDIDDF